MKIEGIKFDGNENIENALKALIEKANNAGNILAKDFIEVYDQLDDKESEAFDSAMYNMFDAGEIIDTDLEKSEELINSCMLIGTVNGKNVLLKYTTWNSPYFDWYEQINGYQWKARIVLEESIEELDPNKVDWEELYEKYIELQKENRKLNKMIETFEEATDHEYTFDENGDLVC